VKNKQFNQSTFIQFMKKVFLLPSVLLFSIATLQAQSKAAKLAARPTTASTSTIVSLRSNNDSLSYAFGISLGSYLKSQGISNVNFALLTKAIDQTLKGQKTYLNMEAANQLMGKLVEVKQHKAAGGEKLKGKQFLEQNKKRSGIVETSSGLQYEILTKGTGPIPKATDTVMAHYRGMLLDGKEFDNSYKRGEPLTIPVAGVIPGWTEALQLMPVGSKWKLYIPSSAAYGDYGAGQDIPGGATLTFEIELVGIGSKKPQ
jgi:FKBP-type peptidyl-prolyl cis-trans isomerase FklB